MGMPEIIYAGYTVKKDPADGSLKIHWQYLIHSDGSSWMVPQLPALPATDSLELTGAALAWVFFGIEGRFAGVGGCDGWDRRKKMNKAFCEFPGAPLA